MTMHNLTGQTLGQYELREILGAGGMGIAYKGYQRNLEREVAIKVLFPTLALEAGFTERFYREAKTAAALEHAHIVPVYDYGLQGNVSYVVMRLLAGGTLEDRMARRIDQNLPLPSLGETSRLLGQLASALDYAHHRGVIHRDIKPSNIMFDDQGIAYIVDFGIAKLMESSTSYTSSGSPIGTPMYMPPEQWKSETLTPAADQYALAITIYQLITGRLPFEATTPYGLLHKHLNEEPTPPQTYRADVPLPVQEVLSRAMEKDPAKRWESVTAMATAFDNAIRGQTGQLSGFFEGAVVTKKNTLSGANSLVMISPTSPLMTATQTLPPYKQPVFWVMGVLLAVAAAVVAVLLLTQGNQGSTPKTVSEDTLRGTVLAELALSQTAQVDAGQTADARVAIALTGTAQVWTPTPTPNLDATATRQAIFDARSTADAGATATQIMEAQITALAGATSTQDALLIIAGATADARSAATQNARDQAATATQESLAQTATMEFEVAGTEAAQAQTSTAEVRALATQEAAATATQGALLIVAQQTADARATGTQAALDQEATANAATATPTPTLTPTATPVPPDLRAIFNADEFILVNISGGPVDISPLVFESKGAEGDQRTFLTSAWSSAKVDLTNMADGGCLQVVTSTATQLAPTRSKCPTFLGWFRANAPDRYFWLAPQPDDTFTVRLADSDKPFASCTISDGQCEFALP
jgi:serine/threonine protein kinase